MLEQLQRGFDVILEIDWQGARYVKQQMGGVSVFILPPSREILQTRLQSRQQDSTEVIAQRMNKASHEISHYSEYDYVVVNDNFDEACEDLIAIIRSQRVKTAVQAQRFSKLIASFE